MSHRKSNKWITKPLLAEIQQVFQPKYKRTLTDDELKLIAHNLVNFVENYARWRCNNGKENTNQTNY